MTTIQDITITMANDGILAEHDEAHLLAERARRHLWLHFSRMGRYSEDNEIPVIVRGEGPWVYDSRGKRYFDGISSLFTSQLGHGRKDLAAAAGKQAEELAYFPLWTYAHPNAINLAAELAQLAPGDLNRVFFTSGGAESVESAWKLARAYHRINGDQYKYKAITRNIAYHGTTMGALALTSVPDYRTPFEPMAPGAVKAPNTNFYRAPEHADDEVAFGRWAADEIERAIEREGADTVAAIFLEPVQNAGGCFPPPPGYLERVREIANRHNVLLVFDETICAFGRLGDWFGANKFNVAPDIITCAKGLTSAYSPLGAMIASDRLIEPFLEGNNSFLHGFTFAGNPVSTAVALKNIEIFKEEKILEHVNELSPKFRAALEGLYELPIVGNVRGEGFFFGIELVKDRETKASFDADQSDRLLRGYLSGALYDAGLICRSDDRGDPVVQLAPPLISTEDELMWVVDTVRSILAGALEKI